MMNFVIEPFYHTTSLQSIQRMLPGEQRKAPLFVGREQVEGVSNSPPVIFLAWMNSSDYPEGSPP